MTGVDVGAALMWTALIVALAALIVAFNVGSARTRRGDDQLKVLGFLLFAGAATLAIAGVWSLAMGGVFR